MSFAAPVTPREPSEVAVLENPTGAWEKMAGKADSALRAVNTVRVSALK